MKHGGVIKDGDAVVQFLTNGKNATIRTASGAEYTADGVAICAGTWARSFLKEFLDLNLPLQVRNLEARCIGVVIAVGCYSPKS